MRIMVTTHSLFILMAITLWAAPEMLAQEKTETETRVTMKSLPASVQQTVKKLSKDAILRGLAKEVENGQTFYEVELKVNGHNRDVLIDPSGKIVQIEEEVALSSLPPAVRDELIKQAGKGRILEIESVTKDNTIAAYEAHVKTGRKKSEIKIDPNGKLIAE